MNKRSVVFDIDGTLVQSFEFDELLYIEAVQEVTQLEFDPDWSTFPHITDSGILKTFWESHTNTELPKNIHKGVKLAFTHKIQAHISSHPVKPVAGALDFFESLRLTPDISIAFATGGWRETAELKLNSAGFNISDLPLASSNDHHIRTEIMKAAVSDLNTIKPVYLGDGEWDKRACEELGWPFIAVGSRVSHKAQLTDFTQLKNLDDFLRLLLD